MDISKMSIAQIKEKISNSAELSDNVLELLACDSRSGVRNLYAAIIRQRASKKKEEERLQGLLKYEKSLWAQGYSLIAGVDEAGRGPLAGPVVAAAVVLKKGTLIQGINDSKKLTPIKRHELEQSIRKTAVAYSVGIVSEADIDEINIYQASLKAMRKAVLNLSDPPEYLLVDAVKVPGLAVPQKAILHGDALSCSIAAASILAKETRDRIMLEYDELFPQYGFAQHKGYGTPQHLEALKKYGPCPIHRKSFGQVRQIGT